MRCKHIVSLAIALLISAAAIPLAAAPRGWEPVKSERVEAKTVVKETDIEIKGARGVIIVSTNHPVQIKVVTILGRTVASDNLPAGTLQLSLPHGVYIVKIGELTCKVAV